LTWDDTRQDRMGQPLVNIIGRAVRTGFMPYRVEANPPVQQLTEEVCTEAGVDAAEVYEYQRIPEVLRYLPWPMRERAEAYAHTARRAAGRMLAADGDFVFFAAILPGAAADGPVPADRDRLIGDVMIRVSSVQHAQLELGWVLHPDFQGRGYAREAATAVRDFAFEHLNPHRVQAFLDARNAASAALCERLGMRREATLLEEEFNDGEWQDTAVYGILRREWAALRA